MSGTSLDGIDAVLARFDPNGHPTILSRTSVPFTTSLKDELLALNTSGRDELARAALASNALVDLYAQAVGQALAQASVSRSEVVAIGAHGQTVRHCPNDGYTIQLNAPARLAELTGINVIADFRSRDVAAGGQGAPLVPMFHAGVFAAAHTRVVLNLGGIANITILRPEAEPQGFDTGPANALMDLWCHLHTGHPFDANGQWGAGGTIDPRLLEVLTEGEPWFALPPPKSTGRDLFNRSWLQQRLTQVGIKLEDSVRAQDVQATLRALTAQTVVNAIQTYAPDAKDLLVCGGGAHNAALLNDLRKQLGYAVEPTDTLGIGTQDVEALAFAWLAWAHQQRIAVSRPAVTGTRGNRILGACWPA
jgi:anhydro-N-acetylmuramic acid kinase